MKRADVNAADVGQIADAVAHLFGGLVRECNRTNIVRSNAPFNKGRDTTCDHSRFSAAGTCQDEQCPIRMVNRLLLTFRQLLRCKYFV